MKSNISSGDLEDFFVENWNISYHSDGTIKASSSYVWGYFNSSKKVCKAKYEKQFFSESKITYERVKHSLVY